MDINADQREAPVRKLQELLGDNLEGKTVGLLGLAFKPTTDDMRDAPSIDIAHHLMRAGAQVRAYDPAAMENARRVLPEVELVNNAYEVADSADGLILVTEWNEFKNMDLKRVKTLMNRPILVDGRNVYDPVEVREVGFQYRGIGRGYDGKGVENG
jgi:UDPglucose 6-dehydrogenase